jgi:hypothetical protein
LPGPQAQVWTWTVRQWLEFWVSEVGERLCPSTVCGCRTIVYRHLIPHLGREPVLRRRSV